MPENNWQRRPQGRAAVEGILALLDRGFSCAEIAACAGVSAATVHNVKRLRELPGRHHAAERLERCAEINSTAARRSDLKFVP